MNDTLSSISIQYNINNTDELSTPVHICQVQRSPMYLNPFIQLKHYSMPYLMNIPSKPLLHEPLLSSSPGIVPRVRIHRCV